MNNSNPLPCLKDWSLDNIAKLCCLAMGLNFGSNETRVEENDEDVIPRALVPITNEEEADDVLCLRVVEKPDTETEQWVYCDACGSRGCSVCDFEGGWWDDRSSIDAYFTTSGESPVTQSVADQVDAMRSAGGFNEVEQTFKPYFYSAAKPTIRPSANVSNIVMFILDCDKIIDLDARQARLRKGWKRLWERHFTFAQCAEHYLTPRDLKRVVNMFAERNIRAIH